MQNTKTSPLISFIVPCYNVGEYVEKCIRSIMDQKYQNIEIIPINDGSNDCTPQILEMLSHEDNRIKVIHKLNEGVSAARNSGLELAHGDYVVFVDGDDYLSADYSNYMLHLANIDDADVVLSKNCYIQYDQNQIITDHIETITAAKATILLLSPRIMVGCWNKMYRKDFLDRNNIRFSTTLFYGEGLHFITKASQLANKVTVGELRVYYYRKNNNASATMKYNIQNHYNGEIAIERIKNELICKDPEILDAIDVHKSGFALNALIQTYANRLNKTYQNDCDHWKSVIRTNLPKILRSGYMSLYRKLLIIGGVFFPAIYWRLNKIHRIRMAKVSVK